MIFSHFSWEIIGTERILEKQKWLKKDMRVMNSQLWLQVWLPLHKTPAGKRKVFTLR